MSGTINVARALFEDEDFANETYTEREAWLWLIMQARWKAGRKHIGHTVIDLNRGQLAASVRFMAEAWNWSKSRVDRFLKRLIDREKIRVTRGTVVSTITICNYDKYQGRAEDGGTPAGQAWDTCGTKKKKGEIREYYGGGSAREPCQKPPPEPATLTWRERMLDAMGCDRSGITRPGAKIIGGEADMLTARGWLNDLGLTPEQVLEVIRDTMRTKRDPGPPSSFRFFTKAMQRFAADIAEAARPIEAIQPRPLDPQSTSPTHGGRHARAERAAFGYAMDQLAAGLSAGTIKLDTSRSDPFAKRSR